MTSRLLRWTPLSSWKGGTTALGVPLAAATVACCSLILWQSSNAYQKTTLDDADASTTSNTGDNTPISYHIDVDFMDKLASKAYLHFLGHETSHHKAERPVGVPDTLRILTVDLPEVRRGFRGGVCSVDARRVYPDGIASPEIIETTKQGRSKKISVPVEQKAWVKSMVRCMAQQGKDNDNNSSSDKVSVEILEADVSRMNPSNIRRIHQYGTMRYDPGKYTVTSPRTDRKPRSSPRGKSLRDDDETKLLSELQAPWHQQSWKEEAMLRISGQVGFGESLVESDQWMKWMFGHEFRSTIPYSRSVLDSVFFWRIRKAEDGVDGSPNSNQASNRPHCVIANGMALQLVPNSLRVLQKLCAEYDVPLFVIRDPRSWGGNTHPDDLGEVLRDVQKTVKSRIVTESLRHSAGTAFSRGRYVGRLEADASWQAKEAARRAKNLTDRFADAFRKQKDSDWSALDEEDLEQRLESHGLVRTISSDDHSEATSPKKELTEALVKIAARYGASANMTDDKLQSKSDD